MVSSAALAIPQARRSLWSAVVLAGMLAVALAMRLVNLEAYTGKFDEGIRAEQLLLMSAGYRPVRDIFAAQGPLSLDIFYPPYLLFGQTLGAARAAVVLYSLLGLAAVGWVGRLGAGPLGGGLAAALLVLSPLYLKNSRLALLEVPVLAPATVALGAALVFQASGRRAWLVPAAVAFALALLIKPMGIAVAVPLGLVLLLRPNRRPLDFVQFGAVAVAVGGLVVLLYGPEQVYQQVVLYRELARANTGWSLRGNWSILSEELRDEQLPIYALAAAGAIYLAVARPRQGLPLAAWPLASFGLLLIYSPLQFKHAAILLPPMMLVVGTAAASVVSGFTFHVSRSAIGARGTWNVERATITAGVLVVLGAWYATSLPAIVRQDWVVISAATESRIEPYVEEAELIPRLTRADEYVIVDDPIVAYNSRRLVPPSLVDTSSYRVRSGALKGAEIVGAAERHDVKLLFLFSDGLREIRTFEEYVDGRYRAVKIWERQNAKDRALYLRDDADFESARAVLARDLDLVPRVDFGGDLRLLGYNLGRDDPRAGSSTSLTLHWEALRPMAIDYRVLTHLRGPGGEPHFQSERGLGGGGEGTASWEAGRWVFRSQVLTIPPRAAPGEYELSVELFDSKSRTSPPVTAGDGLGGTEVVLGRLRVR